MIGVFEVFRIWSIVVEFWVLFFCWLFVFCFLVFIGRYWVVVKFGGDGC